MKKKRLFAQGLKFFEAEKRVLVFCVVFSVLCGVLPLVLPVLEGLLLGSFASTQNTIQLASWLFAVGIVLELCRFFFDFCVALLCARVEKNVKMQILGAISKIRIKSLDSASTGVFTTRLNEDSMFLSQSYVDIFSAFTDVCSNAAFVLFLIIASPVLGAYTLFGICLQLVLEFARSSVWTKDKRALLGLTERVNGISNEIVVGIKETKQVGGDVVGISKAENELEKLKKAKIEHDIRQSIFFRSRGILETLLAFGFVLLSVMLVRDGRLFVSTFFVVFIYRTKTDSFVFNLVGIRGKIAETKLATERVLEIVEGNRKFLHQNFGNVEIKRPKGKIECVNVGIGFTNKKLLIHKINFVANPNSSVAIVGASGSGKTTFLSVLAGEQKPTCGIVLFDDKDIFALSSESKQKSVTFVSCTPFFFSGTVRENLAMANPTAGFDEIVEAARLANVHDTITTRPKGYDSELGGKNSDFSSGEKERMALARAILKNSRIILLDEPTQNQDEENKKQIIRAIAKLKQNHTIVVATHDKDLAESCDNVWKIKNGRLFEVKGKNKGAM